MHRRAFTALALAGSLLWTGSAIVAAADEPSPEPSLEAAPSPVPAASSDGVSEDLVATLCGVAPDEAAVDACLDRLIDEVLAADEAGGLVTTDQLTEIIDRSVAAAEGLDVPAAVAVVQAELDAFDLEQELRDAIASGESDVRAAIGELQADLDAFDLQAAIDDAVADAADVDPGALIEEALGSASEVDPGALVDDLVLQVRSSGAYGTIEEGVTTVRAVVGAAQTWVEENPEEACGAGSFAVGAGAAAVVGLLTESPGLAFAAYGRVESVVNDTCGSLLE